MNSHEILCIFYINSLYIRYCYYHDLPFWVILDIFAFCFSLFIMLFSHFLNSCIILQLLFPLIQLGLCKYWHCLISPFLPLDLPFSATWSPQALIRHHCAAWLHVHWSPARHTEAVHASVTCSASSDCGMALMRQSCDSHQAMSGVFTPQNIILPPRHSPSPSTHHRPEGAFP